MYRDLSDRFDFLEGRVFGRRLRLWRRFDSTRPYCYRAYGLLCFGFWRWSVNVSLRKPIGLMRPFSRWRWLLLCLCGLRHRAGESVMLCQKGAAPRRSSRCSRCGVKGKGLGH